MPFSAVLDCAGKAIRMEACVAKLPCSLEIVPSQRVGPFSVKIQPRPRSSTTVPGTRTLPGRGFGISQRLGRIEMLLQHADFVLGVLPGSVGLLRFLLVLGNVLLVVSSHVRCEPTVKPRTGHLRHLRIIRLLLGARAIRR